MKLLASICLFVISFVASGGRAFAGTIYASGQLFIPAVPNVHDDIRGNRIFAFDTLTGLATPLTPTLTGRPAGLAGATDGRLLGFNNGRLGAVSLPSGTFSNLGGPSGVSATGFDVMSNGRGYVVPFTGNRQLHEINLSTGAVSGIGTPTTIGDALDVHYGLVPGTSEDRIYLYKLSQSATPLLIGNTRFGTAFNTVTSPDVNDSAQAVFRQTRSMP